MAGKSPWRRDTSFSSFLALLPHLWRSQAPSLYTAWQKQMESGTLRPLSQLIERIESGPTEAPPWGGQTEAYAWFMRQAMPAGEAGDPIPPAPFESQYTFERLVAEYPRAANEKQQREALSIFVALVRAGREMKHLFDALELSRQRVLWHVHDGKMIPPLPTWLQSARAWSVSSHGLTGWCRQLFAEFEQDGAAEANVPVTHGAFERAYRNQLDRRYREMGAAGPDGVSAAGAQALARLLREAGVTPSEPPPSRHPTSPGGVGISFATAATQALDEVKKLAPHLREPGEDDPRDEALAAKLTGGRIPLQDLERLPTWNEQDEDEARSALALMNRLAPPEPRERERRKQDTSYTPPPAPPRPPRPQPQPPPKAKPRVPPSPTGDDECPF